MTRTPSSAGTARAGGTGARHYFESEDRAPNADPYSASHQTRAGRLDGEAAVVPL
jgi:hypothetical protein